MALPPPSDYGKLKALRKHAKKGDPCIRVGCTDACEHFKYGLCGKHYFAAYRKTRGKVKFADRLRDLEERVKQLEEDKERQNM